MAFYFRLPCRNVGLQIYCHQLKTALLHQPIQIKKVREIRSKHHENQAKVDELLLNKKTSHIREVRASGFITDYITA